MKVIETFDLSIFEQLRALGAARRNKLENVHLSA